MYILINCLLNRRSFNLIILHFVISVSRAHGEGERERERCICIAVRCLSNCLGGGEIEREGGREGGTEERER